MKLNGKWNLLLILMLMFSLSLAIGCGDDDDDDDDSDNPNEDDDDAVDDDDDDTSNDDDDDTGDDDDDDTGDDDDTTDNAVEEFCAKVESCDDLNPYVIDGACEASAEQMDEEALDCANEESCEDFEACVEDTSKRWLYDPIILYRFVYVVSSEFGGYMSELEYGSKISPLEEGTLGYQYNDQNECDIPGGTVWGKLDDDEWEQVTTISSNAGCKQTGYDMVDVFDIDGPTMDEGDHTYSVVFVDEGGQQSAVKEYNFSIEIYDGGLGSKIPELEDSSFYLPGINDPSAKDVSLQDIYFDQFAGQILLINLSATWCGYCQDEADELMEIYNQYNGSKVDVEFMTLLIDLDEGEYLTELLEWEDREDPHEDITYPLMADDNAGFGGDYFLNGGVPFNMIVDSQGVVRYKIHGYASSIGDDFADIIDALLLEK